MRPHARPPWWPEDEPWPPEPGSGGWSGPPWAGPRWRDGAWGGTRWAGARHRGGMRRAFGCFVAVLATLVVSIGVLVLWLLANLFGLAGEGFLTELARPAGVVVLLAGLVALVVGIRLVRGVAGPLGELVDAAHRIEAGDYAVRVSERERGPGEMRGLGRAFNGMAERLESEDATRRRLLADVSHELRTPLAVIQGNLEALLDGVYPPDEAHLTPILEETRVLERLIDDLRTLSLAESGALPLHREPTDPAVLLEDVAAAHRARAAESRVEVRVDTHDALPTIDVDAVRMRQVLSNLVDNAVRAMPDGGSIVLSAARRETGVVLAVTDDGPGIPADLRESVFERFTKSEASRGSGLGLAIARAIVEAHGGGIAAASGPSGNGTSIVIELPATMTDRMP